MSCCFILLLAQSLAVFLSKEKRKRMVTMCSLLDYKTMSDTTPTELPFKSTCLSRGDSDPENSKMDGALAVMVLEDAVSCCSSSSLEIRCYQAKSWLWTVLHVAGVSSSRSVRNWICSCNSKHTQI
ncbi:hypothetical protein CHARACLAT_004881 [Characodon lateralis]|uniref:Secreted protein n=1 Tax=Characodon lateralis TaxID=208331 RepID=A0ABU7DXS6_9TELE|nr:hypothetical protein [Characodon lateralis]